MKQLHQIIFWVSIQLVLFYLTQFSIVKSNLYETSSPNLILGECKINFTIFTQFSMVKSNLYETTSPNHILDRYTINFTEINCRYNILNYYWFIFLNLNLNYRMILD